MHEYTLVPFDYEAYQRALWWPIIKGANIKNE